MVNSGIPQIQVNSKAEVSGEKLNQEINQLEVEQSDFAKLMKGIDELPMSDESDKSKEADEFIESPKKEVVIKVKESINNSKLNILDENNVNTDIQDKENSVINKDLKHILTQVEGQEKRTVDFKTKGNETVKISSILGTNEDILKKIENEAETEKPISSFFVHSKKSKKLTPSTDFEVNLKSLGQMKNQNMQSMKAYTKPEERSLFIKDNINIEKSELNKKLNSILGKMESPLTNDGKIPEMTIDNSDNNLNLEESKVFLETKNTQVKNLESLPTQVKTTSLNMNSLGSANTEAIIDKISEHISLQKLGSMNNIDLNVNHDSLGQFKITVSQLHNHDNIELQIVSSKKETMDFFKDNETAMMKSLQSAGVKVGDLKLVTTLGLNTSNAGESLEQKFSDQRGSSFSESESENGKNHRQQGSDQHRGSQKRKELWNHYKQQMSA